MKQTSETQHYGTLSPDAALGRSRRRSFRRRPLRDRAFGWGTRGALRRRPLGIFAPELLAGESRAVDQSLQLRPHDLRMHARKVGDLREAAIGARDHVLAADQTRQPHDTLGDELRMP